MNFDPLSVATAAGVFRVHLVAGTNCMQCHQPVYPTEVSWYVEKPFSGLLHNRCKKFFNFVPHAPNETLLAQLTD